MWAIGEHCDFGHQLNIMVRDRLVCGINDTRIQGCLLQETDLTYKQAFETAQAMEVAAHETQQLQSSLGMQNLQSTVHRFQQVRVSNPTCYRCGGNLFAKNWCRISLKSTLREFAEALVINHRKVRQGRPQLMDEGGLLVTLLTP